MGAHIGALAAQMRESGPAPIKLDRLSHQIATDADKDSKPANDRQGAFADQRSAALALLNSDARLSRKAGSFLGQCTVDPTPLTRAQLEWLETLLDRAAMPPLEVSHG